MKPAIKKLPAGASNQFIFRLASFKRRFVDKVEILTKNNNAKKDNKLLNDNTELKTVNEK
jgi:hypothetical protein